MKKKSFWSIFVMFIMSLGVFAALSACSDDDKDGDAGIDRALVGTWKYSNITMVFEADGSGVDLLEFDNPALNSKNTFEWSADGYKLTVTFDNDNRGSQLYYYDIMGDGKSLVMYYSDGEHRGVFTKQ